MGHFTRCVHQAGEIHELLVLFLNFSIKSSNFYHVCVLEEHLVLSNYPVPLRHGGFKNPKTLITTTSRKRHFTNAFGIIASTFYVGRALLSFVRGFTRLFLQGKETSMDMEYFSYVRRYPPHRQASVGNSDPCSNQDTNEGRCRRSRSELCLTYSSHDRRILKPFPWVCGGKEVREKHAIKFQGWDALS
jgi:hypothetical protein